MKDYDFSHWDLSASTKGLRFFAQALEEMLFHYGHDSLKVPALNFRFLCVEIVSTIRKIEENVIDKANIKPLIEELKDSYEKDPIVRELYGSSFDTLFLKKNVKGAFQSKCTEIFKDPSSDASLKRIGKTIQFLLDDMEIGDKYYASLKEKIETAIQTIPFDHKTADELYGLSKILLTDLVNYAYSHEYIYLVVNDVFYNRQKQITSITDTMNSFWQYFDFTEREYCIYLPLKKSSYVKHLQRFDNITVSENANHFFNDSCNWIVSCSLKAMDPEQARLDATHIVGLLISLLQYNNHKSTSFSARNAVVVDKSSDKTYHLKAPVPLLRRGANMGENQDDAIIATMVENFAFSHSKIANVLELHSSALESNDVNNQLLNLWTIIEILIPVEQKNSFSKINQICNSLTSVLSMQYIYSLIMQLAIDMQRCVPEIYDDIKRNVQEGDSPTEKMAAFLALSKHEAKRAEVVGKLELFPLLEYRIMQYHLIFFDRARIKSFLNAHSERLQWQIMRIYRNRNMIVHDGHYFPYISIIVQNLHFYVDSLIDFVNSFAGRGYNSIQSAFSALQQAEFKRLLLLDEKGTDGKSAEITDDFIAVVLGRIL